jgi:hypothetical protein
MRRMIGSLHETVEPPPDDATREACCARSATCAADGPDRLL